MTDDANPLRDEDLARWAKELGVSYEELASIRKQSVSAIRSRLFRARIQLRQSLYGDKR